MLFVGLLCVLLERVVWGLDVVVILLVSVWLILDVMVLTGLVWLFFLGNYFLWLVVVLLLLRFDLVFVCGFGVLLLVKRELYCRLWFGWYVLCFWVWVACFGLWLLLVCFG